MMKQVKIAVGAAVIAAPLFGLACPAAAAPVSSTAAPAPTFAMPSLTGMTLANANVAIAAISPGIRFRTKATPKGGEPVEIKSPGSWVVCRQYPTVETKITAKQTISLTVERPWNGC